MRDATLEARPGPAPRSVPYPQFCMQFPDTCSSSLSEKPGISMITFQSMKCVRGNCMRICVDRALPPPTGTADRPSGPSGALHTGDAWRAEVWLGAVPRSPARPRRRPSISHVIPLRLVQTLNLRRWNCNVFGVSRKMTTINYVRNLGGGGVVAARGHRRLALSARPPAYLKPSSPLRVRAEPRLKPSSPLLACTCVGLKPSSPLLAGICGGLKPSSPLRARNGCFWCSFRVQR